MDLYGEICRRFVIPAWAWWEGSPYLEHLDDLLKTQYLPLEEMRKLQWHKARRLLNHAYQNVPLYRRMYDEAGIHPGQILANEDFLRVPLLLKDDVRTQRELMMASGYDRYTSFKTSGSTGKPIVGFWNKESSEFKRACARRSEIWGGYRLGERIFCLYGDPEREMKGARRIKAKIRRKFLARTEILDMLDLSDESMLRFAKKMRAKPPSLLWGHAHGLFLFANFLDKKGFVDIRPKGIFSAGMVLHDWERIKIEEVFGCRMQDRYGCEELGLIATECKAHRGLHINMEGHLVEFLGADGRPVEHGESGQVVVTDLTNYVMPFIRYRLEDVGTPSDEVCPCGITQPLISRIQGRVADFIATPEGKLVSGISLTDHFAARIPGVEQIQIVQEKLDSLTLNIVKAPDFDDNSSKVIAGMIVDFFGRNMKVQYCFLDRIPQESSGKYRFVISKIGHDRLFNK